MAMDYLDGRGLDQIRRRSRSLGHGLTMAMQLRVVCDMLAGLDYAHNLTDFDGSPLNIVHRDVSPQNVFVTFDGQVKLLDFGIAKASDSVHETRAGVVKGKVAYMSPEQGRGWKVDARSDVFSAGVMLWEALTGKRMREGQNDQEKMWALASEDIPRASSIAPAVPPALDAICACAMAWNRDDRYASAAEMQRELERYLVSTGTNASAREVGTSITELFREDRANTNTVIEAHVARLRGGQVRDKLPIIDVASRAGGQSATPSNERASQRLLRPRSETGLTSIDPPSLRSGDASIALHETRSSGGRNLRSVLIAGVTGVVVAAVVIILVARATQDAASFTRRAEPAPAGDVPALQATRPAPAGKPSFVDVEIRVIPEAARISIDGTDVDGNPFVSRYTSDAAVHHVRASAPGHVAKSVPVSFDSRVALEIKLEPVTAPAASPEAAPARTAPVRTAPVRTAPPRTAPPRRAPVRTPPKPAVRDSDPTSVPAAPAPAPRPRTDVDPAGGTKPRRPIDLNNPYGAGE
jgi:serine/threonine-protein kinase